VFGKRIRFQIQDITPTFLSLGVLSQLRQADDVAHMAIRESGESPCHAGYTIPMTVIYDAFDV